MWTYCLRLIMRQHNWPDSIIAEKLIIDGAKKGLNFWLYEHNHPNYDFYIREERIALCT